MKLSDKTKLNKVKEFIRKHDRWFNEKNFKYLYIYHAHYQSTAYNSNHKCRLTNGHGIWVIRHTRQKRKELEYFSGEAIDLMEKILGKKFINEGSAP